MRICFFVAIEGWGYGDSIECAITALWSLHTAHYGHTGALMRRYWGVDSGD